MLLRRLQTLLKIHERRNPLRLHLAGTHVQSNLQSQFGTSINQRLCASKPYVNVYKNQRWLTSGSKRYGVTGDHALVDDDTSPILITENNHAREVVVNSKKAPKSIGLPLETIENVSREEVEEILRLDFKSLSADEILKAFVSVSCYAKLKETPMCPDKHGPILIALTEKLQDLDDEQLRRVFQCLVLWPQIGTEKCQSYVDLWNRLDKICIERFPNWSVEEALMFFDYMYQVQIARKTRYSWAVVDKFGGKPKKLNAVNFLHFMFLVNVGRRRPVNMYEIEYRLAALVDEFTVNELGVIALAFFKTSTPFRDPILVTKMQQKVLMEWDDMTEICLSAIMKITRYSMNLKELTTLQAVFNRMKEQASNLSLMCLTHAVHAAAFVQYYDRELIELIIKRFENEIDSARLKDLERLCWVLLIFNYDAKTPLFKKIVESLRNPQRQEERAKFPKVVAACLTHLSYSGVFPLDLIKEQLDPEFLNKLYGENPYKTLRSYFELENNLRIDVPEYDGPFLKDDVRQFLAKKYTSAEIKEKVKARSSSILTLEVAHLCKSVLGSDTAVHIDQVLPHYVKPDVLICLDGSNVPTAPKPFLSQIPSGKIKYAPRISGQHRWLAVILATQNQMLRKSSRHIGLLANKIRQLKKIGYIPLVIYITEWRSLDGLEAKENYLRNMLLPTASRKVSADAI